MPGMIDEPAWASGSFTSPIPPTGPDDSTVRSAAIFASDAEQVRSSPDTLENTSMFCMASKELDGAWYSTPVMLTRCAYTDAR
ncbi:hypothetical protein D3C85_1276990 [compost metagenome]